MDVFNKNEHSQVPFLSISALFLDDIVVSKESVTERLRDCSHKNKFLLRRFAQKRNFLLGRFAQMVKRWNKKFLISFLSFLFCFHCCFSKLTAQGRCSVTEVQNDFKRVSFRSLFLCLSLSLSLSGVCTFLICFPMKYRDFSVKINSKNK